MAPIITAAQGWTLLQHPVIETSPIKSALHVWCTGYLLVGSDFVTNRGLKKIWDTHEEAEDIRIFMTITKDSSCDYLL